MKGGKRPGAGRPPESKSKKPTKDYYIHIRITQDQQKAIKAKAEFAGLTISEYVLRKLGIPGR